MHVRAPGSMTSQYAESGLPAIDGLVIRKFPNTGNWKKESPRDAEDVQRGKMCSNDGLSASVILCGVIGLLLNTVRARRC